MHPIETSRSVFEKRLEEPFQLSQRPGVFSIIVFLIACQILLPCCQEPLYKEAYLQQFEEFSSRVEANCGQLTIAGFKALDPTYQQFSRKWYEQFEQCMTLAEKAQVWKYRSRYLKCKGLHILEDKAEQLFQQVEGRLISTNS